MFKNSQFINRFVIKEGFYLLKNIKSKLLFFKSFFVVSFFYSPLLFSDLNKEGAGESPFMNNAQETLNNLGIDRETFQKLFQTLHHENLDWYL